MDDRPPPRQVWRPSFARNRIRRDSDGSVDDQASDTSDQSRSPRGRGGGGYNRRGEGRRNPNGSGRLGDLREQLKVSGKEYSAPIPQSTRSLIESLAKDQSPQDDWQYQGRKRGARSSGQGHSSGSNWRERDVSGAGGHGSQDGSGWRGSHGNISGTSGRGAHSGFSNWRGSQNNISTGPQRRGSQDYGASGYSGPPNLQQNPQDNSRRGGRGDNKRWSNRSQFISKLETLDDWNNLSNLDNTLRIVTKLQEFERSWVQSFHTDAEFDVLDRAFNIFSNIDLKYRYAKLALMKSLFTNKFIERLVGMVEKFKTTWFQAGKDKVLSFIGKLRTNMEFLLSNDAAFHDNASSKDVIGLLISSCVGTLEHINAKLMELQGSTDLGLEIEISDIQGLSEIKFIEMHILDESIHPDNFKERYDVMANIVQGAYQSDDHYIQTHFGLLKEDFQSVLRQGVEQYLIDPKKKNFDIWAYENVRLKRFDPTRKFQEDRKIDNRKLFFRVTFPECAYFSRIQWKYVKRFMFGSLVVLTADKFKTYHLALIDERFLDNADAISIVISFIYSPPSGVEDKKFLLVEPKVFYEPYLNSMKVLKHMAKIGLPMKKYIVNGDTQPALPAYLNPESVYRIGSFDIKVSNILSWPKAEDLGLNRSQKEAFVNALSSDMALIQGPPGTGKTFLAFKMIETLLNNCKKSYLDGPIMIVCYKNHSLDQILEGLLNKGKRVIRIGSQSKIKALKWEYNVRSLPVPPTTSSLLTEKRNLQLKLVQCLADIKHTVALICLIKSGIGILNLEFLKKFQILPSDVDLLVDHWLLELFEEATPMTQEEILFRWNKIRQIPDIADLLNDESLTEVYQLNLFSIGKDFRDLVGSLSQIGEDFVDSDEEAFWTVNEMLSDAYQKFIFLVEGLNFAVDQSDCVDSPPPGFDHYQFVLEERWALYRKWESDLVKQLEARVVDLQNQVPEIEENLSEYEEMVMSQTLKYERPQVIGVTTSGATKHYSALADVGAKIVLVEEAAEVLEAHVIASLSTKCQHLILIGDHQQLKPNTASHEIGTRYRMNVSLFERMIKNDIRLSCLSTQHRMRPEISALICPSIYKNLENHPHVLEYPNVIGTKKNVYFFNHQHLEQVGFDSDSKLNPGEGDMLVAIAHYLLRQGYKPDQITILSTYLEQDRYIKKAIDRYYSGTELKEVFCTVVDNYQGEENIIILLSLVRSNVNGDVGFLSTKNRVCVALSRAKHGLFIFGNMTCLSKKEPTIWSEINEVLVGQEGIGPRFPLKCVRHGNVTEVASRQDIEALKHAGCLNPCDAPLQCGHTCKVMCHGQDQGHTGMFQCREKCMKRCNNGHTCQAPCRDPCPPCPVMMPTVLVCGHSRQLECHKANLQAYCTETVEIKLERCGHNQLVLCKLTEQSERHRIVCKSDCKQTFQCGHVCKRTCHVSDDPDHKTKFLCEEPCELINKSCPRKHRCKKKCRVPCGDCLVDVEKTLPCGHKAEMKCCADIDGFQCHQNCERKLPCGHDCKNECCDTCGPCKIKVDKVIEECGHAINFKCSDTPTRSHCKQPCQTVKSCAHPCTGMCKEICEELTCESLVDVVLPCGHQASVACGDTKRKRYLFTTECKAPCKAKLPCGHRCKGTCGRCMEGRVHVPCDEICNKPLFCIHKCSIRCNDSLHSCPNPKCFNTCWRNELKNQPVGFRQSRGKKKPTSYNPKTRMAFEIRSALTELNRNMGLVARNFNGNKIVVQGVKRIQLLVNKSRAITMHDEELPILKSCLFKVEFITFVFKVMVRLGVMKLSETRNLELEHFMESLVIRVASNSLMGFFEMTQIQEQLVWVSMILDTLNSAATLGVKNDSALTERILNCLNETKSSFGLDERSAIRQMLQEYNERMGLKLPLTDPALGKLFPSTYEFCQPICHHRVDIRKPVGKKAEEADAKAGDVVCKNVAQSKLRAEARSLVSEEYNEDGTAFESENTTKRTKLSSGVTNEEMDVEEVPSGNEAIRDGPVGVQPDSGSVCMMATTLQFEVNAPVKVNENTLVFNKETEAQETSSLGQVNASSSDFVHRSGQFGVPQAGLQSSNNENDGNQSAKVLEESLGTTEQDASAAIHRSGLPKFAEKSPVSPYSEASQLLSLMIIEANQPSRPMSDPSSLNGNTSHALVTQPGSSTVKIDSGLSFRHIPLLQTSSNDPLGSNQSNSGSNHVTQLSHSQAKAPSSGLGQGSIISSDLAEGSGRSHLIHSGLPPVSHEPNRGQHSRRLNESSGTVGQGPFGNNPFQLRGNRSAPTPAEQQLQSVHNQFSQFAVDARLSSQSGDDTSSNSLRSVSSNRSTPNKFSKPAGLEELRRAPPPLEEELSVNILQPDAEAGIYIDDID